MGSVSSKIPVAGSITPYNTLFVKNTAPSCLTTTITLCYCAFTTHACLYVDVLGTAANSFPASE